MPGPVAIVAPRYAPDFGGVERHVEALARGLVERGVPVEVLTTDPSASLRPVGQEDGVLVRRFPTLARDGVYYPSPRLLRWAWRHAERYRLIHAHGYHTLVPLQAGIGARRHGTPLVVTPHYHATGHTRFRALLHVPYRPVAGCLLRTADAVIAVSEAERGWLERDFPGLRGVTVIPNGVDLAPVPPKGSRAPLPDPPLTATPAPDSPSSGRTPAADLPADQGPSGTLGPPGRPGEVTLLSVGRLELYKGVQGIVGALPFLPAATRLTVVGQGPAAALIAATADRLGVGDRVSLLGRIPQEGLQARYGAADLFVTLSHEEAFGLTVLEAAAAGAPVLASDIPAHREVRGYVADGRIELVDPDASGAQVAAAITRALALGRSDDRTGWRLPTWSAMVDRVLEVYDAVLGVGAA